MSLNRRNFLILLGAATGTMALGAFPAAGEPLVENPSGDQPLVNEDTFQLPPLPYDYSALEPYIDAETMRFHHDKHHAAYIKNLNAAVNKYPKLKSMSAEDLLRNLHRVPQDIRTTIRNNGGGYVNHKMFWETMDPDGGGEPTGSIATAINETFGSFEAFQELFNEAGSKLFGSGWAWLVLDPKGKLQVTNSQNQDSPLIKGMYPIMGNDVWEHAYYLKYRNDRREYLKQWWNVVNWEEVNRRFEQAKA
ncbi:Fe-Mn family superoxide dismutase [Lyngbya aestuarii]|uniref:Fe-Mn family superoxide dismutase n=1 Tax=Lyngbya aestuarii TaxID=118322 RepID=UPI00403D8B80